MCVCVRPEHVCKRKCNDDILRLQLDPDPAKGRHEKVLVDANKGLQLSDLPYILTLQLKRFDFDYTTMRRIKISDRVSFPDELDLSPFVSKSAVKA